VAFHEKPETGIEKGCQLNAVLANVRPRCKARRACEIKLDDILVFIKDAANIEKFRSNRK
jgi:hypothetical protein